MTKYSIRLMDDSGRHHGVGRMISVFKKSIHNLFILFTIILLSHCTGVGGAPGGAPGNLEGGLGALDTVGTSGPGGVAGNPAAPVSQPTEDGILFLKPQYMLVQVLPPKTVSQPDMPAQQTANYRANTNDPVNWDGEEMAEEYEEDTEPTDPRGAVALDHYQEPLEAQEVPGPFADSQPYVWVVQRGETGIEDGYDPTNDYGYATLRLSYLVPKKDEECETEFDFFACDKISGRIWTARPVREMCPEGDRDKPYEVKLQLMLPATDTYAVNRGCPPTPPEAGQSAPATMDP